MIGKTGIEILQKGRRPKDGRTEGKGQKKIMEKVLRGVTSVYQFPMRNVVMYFKLVLMKNKFFKNL